MSRSTCSSLGAIMPSISAAMSSISSQRWSSGFTPWPRSAARSRRINSSSRTSVTTWRARDFPTVSCSRDKGQTMIMLFLAEFLKSLEESPLGGLRVPRHEIALQCGGVEIRRRPEEAPRLALGKAGEPHSLEIGAPAIGGLDDPDQRRGPARRQAEAHGDGVQKPRFHRLVIAADHRLERADGIADDVFGRVVQEHGEPPGPVDVGW